MTMQTFHDYLSGPNKGQIANYEGLRALLRVSREKILEVQSAVDSWIWWNS